MEKLTKEEIYKKLSAPFTTIGADGKTYPAHKWRVQKGLRCIPYIDARQVSERLNSVLGINGWSDTLEETSQKMMICNLTCIIEGKAISHSDVGTPKNAEAEKSMASDSLKRAAVHFGIGRYLYEIEPVQVSNKVDQSILKDGAKLTSLINQLHPLRAKLSEIFRAIPEENKESVQNNFTAIWNALKI